jgi:hypothetical protein
MIDDYEDPTNFLAQYQNDGRWVDHIDLWNRRTDEQLFRELVEFERSSYGMLRHNAQTSRNLIAAILLNRGVTHISNLLGPIEIKLHVRY